MAQTEVQKKEITEVKARAAAIHISPRKARLVARLLKDLPVEDALSQLKFLTKKATRPISKLIDSAVANASHNHQVEKERLFIKNLTIDGVLVYMRYMPRAQGRAVTVRKRTSHMNLILGISKKPIKAAKKQGPAKLMEQVSEVKIEPVETKPSRFGFLRKKKKEGSGPQLPPKQDPKSRHYTSFDRRGNMGS